jgi:hypothetical protein
MTVGRPYDWSPLGLDSDPVPGDPATVASESRRLGQTVDELRTQIAMLTKISGDTTLKGQYASTLRAHAQQLSQDLNKVAVRYEKVAAATSDWSGQLASAQATSLTALHMAEGPYNQLSRLQAPQAPPSSASSSAKQQYATDKQQYQNAESSAQADMQAAQRLLNEATNQRDTAGTNTAQKISDASHDSLTDSFWDQFKQMISSIAGHLKLAATILGYLAAVCAIIAVILTGPLALVFLLIAGGLLLTELGIHTVLAATGNGSWVDVVLDVVALATLGIGGAFDAGAESLEETAEEGATNLLEESQGLKSASQGLLEQATGLEEDAKALGDDELVELAQQIKAAATKGVNLAKPVAEDAVEGIKEEATENMGSVTGVVKSIVRYGSVTMAKATAFTSRVSETFSDDSEITETLSKLKVLGTRNAINTLSGTAIDATDKILNAASPTYRGWEDDVKGALPADIGIPVVAYAGTLGVTPFVVASTELAK